MSKRRIQIIQSHRSPLPAAWYQRCVASVQQWAELHGCDYCWLGDELFEYLDPALLEKIRAQRIVASDLARLHALESALSSGYDQVVWVDADVLVLAPAEFPMPGCGAWFGREVWIQEDADQVLRVFRKIHNAFMSFSRGDPVLPFYRYGAERILRRYDGEHMVPQLIGPKLLSLLHNAIDFPVIETAAMLSPAVARALLTPDHSGPALERFLDESSAPPLVLNLCGSSVAKEELDDGQMADLVELLLSQPDLLGVA